MDLKSIICEAHHLIEAKEAKRISKREMAAKLGIKTRTLVEYERGKNAPLSMQALLNLLSLLPDAEIVRVVRKWKPGGEIIA